MATIYPMAVVSRKRLEQVSPFSFRDCQILID